MTSCIPIRILVYDGIQQYWFSFGTSPEGTSRVQKHQKDSLSHWLETAAVATFPVVEITDCVHSRDDSFQRVPSGIILIALSVMTVCQCGHKLHRTLSLGWMNILSCVPCTSPAAVECSYSWHRKLATVSRHIFLSLSLLSPEIKKIQLASKISTN